MVLKDEIIEVLKTTEDPELHIDLYTLGLIYDITLDDAGEEARIVMTFTTPFCPYGPAMIQDMRKKLSALGLKSVDIKVVFEPPWEPSPEVREMLGV